MLRQIVPIITLELPIPTGNLNSNVKREFLKSAVYSHIYIYITSDNSCIILIDPFLGAP